LINIGIEIVIEIVLHYTPVTPLLQGLLGLLGLTGHTGHTGRRQKTNLPKGWHEPRSYLPRPTLFMENCRDAAKMSDPESE